MLNTLSCFIVYNAIVYNASRYHIVQVTYEVVKVKTSILYNNMTQVKYAYQAVLRLSYLLRC
jgi:hypothetical protein